MLNCHCIVGLGVPPAVAVKLALPPLVTVWFDGYPLRPNEGATDEVFNVNVAAFDSVVPALLVATQRNWSAFIAVVVPLMFNSSSSVG